MGVVKSDTKTIGWFIQDFRWHDLRYVLAAWHCEVGMPTPNLQRLSGLKTQSMVERYAQVAPEGLQFAASRLDALFACSSSS